MSRLSAGDRCPEIATQPVFGQQVRVLRPDGGRGALFFGLHSGSPCTRDLPGLLEVPS